MLSRCLKFGSSWHSGASRFPLRLTSRRHSLLFTPPQRHEQVAIPSRSSGDIKIDIFHSQLPGSPILIYLPPGPVIPENAEGEGRIISTLASTSGATIALINYRASPIHQFPTPVHDVLLGYDWVKENLLRDGSSRPVLTRMGVCGELVGGSLAIMLALTECRLSESRIGAAAINNPIADWVFPDDLPVMAPSELPEPRAPEETAFPADEDPMSLTSPQSIAKHKPPKRTPKAPPPTVWQLYGDNPIIPTATLSAERDMLFRRPEDFFDRFASPIHFFRSPHGTLVHPKDDDTFASESPNGSVDIETQLDLSHYQSFDDPSTPLELPTLARCRAYARIYPPAGANLSLPTWHLTTGTQSPLLDQASELAKMIKRSVARQTLKSRTRRTKWHDSTEKESYEAYAEKRVLLDTAEGTGLWTEQEVDPGKDDRVEIVGKWMKENLKPDFT